MAWTSRRVQDKMKEEKGREGGSPSPGGPDGTTATTVVSGGVTPTPRVDTDTTRLLDAMERGCYPTALLCVESIDWAGSTTPPPSNDGGRISRIQTECGCTSCTPPAVVSNNSSGGGASLRPPTHPAQGRSKIRGVLQNMSDGGKFCLIRSMLNRLTSGHRDGEDLRHKLKELSLPQYLRPISPAVEAKIVEYMINFPLSVNRSLVHGFMVSFVDFLVALKSPFNGSSSFNAEKSGEEGGAELDEPPMNDTAADDEAHAAALHALMSPAVQLGKQDKDDHHGFPCEAHAAALGTEVLSLAEKVAGLNVCPLRLLNQEWFVPCAVAIRATFGSQIRRLGAATITCEGSGDETSVDAAAAYYYQEMGGDAPAHHRWEIVKLTAGEEEDGIYGGSGVKKEGMSHGSQANRENSSAILCGELLYHGAGDLMDLFEVMLMYPTLRAGRVISHALMQAVLRVQKDGGYSADELKLGLEQSKSILFPHPFIRILRLHRRLMDFFLPLMRYYEESRIAADQEQAKEEEGEAQGANGEPPSSGEGGKDCTGTEPVVPRNRKVAIQFVPMRSTTTTADDDGITPFFVHLVILKLTGLNELSSVVEPFMCWQLPPRLFYQLLQLKDTVEGEKTKGLLSSTVAK